LVTEQNGKRDYIRMRWGLVPRWWSKSLKELRAATFNARAETVGGQYGQSRWRSSRLTSLEPPFRVDFRTEWELRASPTCRGRYRRPVYEDDAPVCDLINHDLGNLAGQRNQVRELKSIGTSGVAGP
jgi:hypothetical protein